MSVLIAIGCLIIFVAGLGCYALAFQMDSDMLSMLVFIGGVLLNCLAFYIPWQVTGHGTQK